MSGGNKKAPWFSILGTEEMPFLGRIPFLGRALLRQTTNGEFAVDERMLGIRREGQCHWEKEGKAEKKEEEEKEYPRGPFNDGVDRQNCYWVPSILLLFAAIIEILSKIPPETNGVHAPGASGPVWCLKTPELNDEEFEYALEFCQTRNHYYVEPGQMPSVDQLRRQIGYYHWVQLMLTLQAILFLFPNFIWIFVQNAGGIDFARFIGWARELAKFPLNCKCRHDGVHKMAAELYSLYFPRKTKHRRFFGCRIGTHTGQSIALFYLCFKLSYLAIALIQFFWLNAFVGDNEYLFWGWNVLKEWTQNGNWQDSRIFPRDTICAVPIRRRGDNPYYILQCHLRVNTYIEKIFLFIWWLLFYVAFVTFLNALYFGIRILFFPCFSEITVRRLLTQREFVKIVESDKKENVRILMEFVANLGYEGICLFWFLQSNCGPIIAREICAHLFSAHLGGDGLFECRREYEPNKEEEKNQQDPNGRKERENESGNFGEKVKKCGFHVPVSNHPDRTNANRNNRPSYLANPIRQNDSWISGFFSAVANKFKSKSRDGRKKSTKFMQSGYHRGNKVHAF